MMCDNGLCASGQKIIKMRMKTPICFNGKGNEIIAWCLLNVWPCFFLSSHHCCMCYRHQCLLHHICASQVNNNNVHQGAEAIFNYKDSIHRWMCQGKSWETSVWTCAPLSKTIVAIIFWNVSWVIVCSFLQGHWSKWVFRLSVVWPH
jgi:hypothetical protein